MSKITDSVLALSNKIMEGVELDAKTGIAKEKSETSLYDANLPEGIKPETVVVIKDYDADFVAASAHAFGQMANQAAQSDTGFTNASLSLRGGHKDTISHTWDRSRTYPNRLAGDGAEVTKHGVLSTTFETRAGKNTGQLKSVRDLIAQQMEELSKA
jgi:hypothetical protein